MGIKGDFEEIVGSWSKLSVTTKIILLAFFLVQCLSIASLSNNIFEFKGFILKGIEFYRFITEPLLIFTQIISLDFISRALLDGVIWVSLFSYSMRKGKDERLLTRKQFILLVIVCVLSLCISFITLEGSEITLTTFCIATVLLLLLTVFTLRTLRKQIEEEEDIKRKNERRASERYVHFKILLPMWALYLGPVITVSTIAAISEGLLR